MAERLSSTLSQEIVERIRATAEPEKIILFGSQARGEGNQDSDLDIFIVLDSDLPRYQRAVPFYQALSGLGWAKDIVVYTPAEVAEWQTASCSLVATVLREGQVLYENQS